MTKYFSPYKSITRLNEQNQLKLNKIGNILGSVSTQDFKSAASCIQEMYNYLLYTVLLPVLYICQWDRLVGTCTWLVTILCMNLFIGTGGGGRSSREGNHCLVYIILLLVYVTIRIWAACTDAKEVLINSLPTIARAYYVIA